MLDRAIALLVPPRCWICRDSCSPQAAICGPCERTIATSPHGISSPRRFAAFEYAGASRELVLALKFRGAVRCAQAMAELMLPRLPHWALDADVLVPAPAHPARRRRRGFNQGRLLADALAARTGARVVDCLARTAITLPQSELSRAERLALPQAAISFSGGAHRPHRANPLAEFPTNVVVCDDVTTTGVTLETCAQVIRERVPESVTGPIRAVTFASAGALGSEAIG